MIFNAGLCEGFFAFAAGPADTAMMLAAFVTTPGLGVVEMKVFAFGCNLSLGETGIRREELNPVPRTEMDGIIHRLDELRTAVGVDGVIAGMISQQDVLEMIVLRYTGSDG